MTDPGAPSSRVRIVALGDSTTAGTPGWLSPLESPPAGAGDETSQYAYWLVSSPAPPGGDSSGESHPGVPAVVESPRATMRTRDDRAVRAPVIE